MIMLTIPSGRSMKSSGSSSSWQRLQASEATGLWTSDAFFLDLMMPTASWASTSNQVASSSSSSTSSIEAPLLSSCRCKTYPHRMGGTIPLPIHSDGYVGHNGFLFLVHNIPANLRVFLKHSQVFGVVLGRGFGPTPTTTHQQPSSRPCPGLCLQAFHFEPSLLAHALHLHPHLENFLPQPCRAPCSCPARSRALCSSEW